MTDVLAERFAALADHNDDSDWLDVRRRARRRTRLAVPLAAAGAAVVAAGAFAASSGWLFSSHDGHVTARTEVALGGRAWHVSYTTSHAHFCAKVTSGSTTRATCGEIGPGSPFGALKLTVPGGQIWTGATVGFARRITITDATGEAHGAAAVKAPRGTKTPFRYWVIATASAARSITAYDATGRKITVSIG
jgi:hypothetical protein